MAVGSLGWIDGKPRYFSGAVSDELAVQLDRAARLTDPLERESILLAARRRWPHALDIMIALYKLYFRTARFPEAERMAWQALREASCQGGFRWNYRLLRPDSADWLEDRSVSRLYLFSLKALGVIRLRQGRVVLAERALAKVLELDPHDEIGAGNFLIIARQCLEDDV